MERLWATSTANLEKILAASDFTNSHITSKARSFLEGDLSRFEGKQAAELVAFCRINIGLSTEGSSQVSPEVDTLDQPFLYNSEFTSQEDTSLRTTYRNFLTSALIHMLTEIYFTPEPDEMAGFLAQTHHWFSSKKDQLSAIPLETEENWKRMNDARVRAISNHRKDLDSRTINALLSSGNTSTQVDNTVYRPSIGRSRAVPRKTFRNNPQLMKLTVNGGLSAKYDFDTDDNVVRISKQMAEEKAGEFSHYKTKDLEQAAATRRENEIKAIDEYYFGETGIGGGFIGGGEASKEELRKSVLQLFQHTDSRRLSLQPVVVKRPDTAPAVTTAAAPCLLRQEPSATETVETYESMSSQVLTVTPALLTKRFSTSEHIKATDWHETTELHIDAVLSTTLTRPSSAQAEYPNRGSMYGMTLKELEARPDRLYGPGSSRALMGAAAASGKAAVEMLRGRAETIGTMVANEAFVGTEAMETPIKGLLAEVGGELIIKPKTQEEAKIRAATFNLEDDEELPLDSTDHAATESKGSDLGFNFSSPSPKSQRRPTTASQEDSALAVETNSALPISPARHAFLRSPTIELHEEEAYHEELFNALEEERFLHHFTHDSGQSDTWLLQHALLARRQPLTPRTQANVEKGHKVVQFLNSERVAAKAAAAAAAPSKGAKGKAGGKGPNQKAAKPAAAAAAKAAKPAGKGKKGEEDDGAKKPIPFMKKPSDYLDTLLPSWQSEGRSLVRLNQDNEIEAIKEKFDEFDLSGKVDHAVLTRALSFPMDKPVSLMKLNLKRPGDGLLNDPIERVKPKTVTKKKGGAKKKGKGGAKKSGSKKKKK
jgi:hypothetical protein